MGQKVNPHGLRVGVIKEWRFQMVRREKISLTTWLKTTRSGTFSKEKIIQRRNLQNRDRESFRSREDHCLLQLNRALLSVRGGSGDRKK